MKSKNFINSFSFDKLKAFCKLSNIVIAPSDSKYSIEKKIKKYLDRYKYAPRYLKDLTDEEKIIKKFEIRLYKLLEKKGKITKSSKYKSSSIDKKYNSKNSKKKISTYTQKWNEKYKSKSLTGKSKISGVPLPILEKVYNRGLSAWRGSSHRPGANQHQWGVSRVNSFLTCGKTWYFPDHLLAKEAMSKSPKVRNFWKKCDKSKMGKRTKSR